MSSRRGLAPLLALTFALAWTADAGAKRSSAARQDKAFAKVVLSATGAIVAAATGEPVDPIWYEGIDSSELIDDTKPETVQAVAELGDFEVVVTAMELEAVTNTDTGRVYLRTLVSVSRKGRVNWLDVELRDGGMLGMSLGLDTASPGLFAGVTRLTESLSAPDCPLPVVQADESWPETLRRETRLDEQALARACSALEDTDYEWAPRVDDVSVLVRAGDRWGILRSFFEVRGDQLVLGHVRYKELRSDL